MAATEPVGVPFSTWGTNEGASTLSSMLARPARSREEVGRTVKKEAATRGPSPELATYALTLDRESGFRNVSSSSRNGRESLPPVGGSDAGRGEVGRGSEGGRLVEKEPRVAVIGGVCTRSAPPSSRTRPSLSPSETPRRDVPNPLTGEAQCQQLVRESRSP